MNRYDFTKTGGFPLTQDVLKDMQEFYLTALQNVCSNFGTGPYAVSGMVQSGGSISSGWFYYNGDLYPFTGGTIPTPGGSDVVLVAITPGAGTLTFNDASTPVVKVMATSAMTTGPTVTDATHFPLSILQKFAREANLTVYPIALSGIIGLVNVRKNFLNNTLQLTGVVTQSAPIAPPYSSYTLAILPPAYRPNYTAYWEGSIQAVGGSVYPTDSGSALMKTMRISLDTAGNLNGILANGSVVYSAFFNVIIPLD